MTDELETTRTLLAAAQVEIARLAMETATANRKLENAIVLCEGDRKRHAAELAAQVRQAEELNGALSIAILWFLDNGRLADLPEKLRPLYDAAVERAAVLKALEGK